MDRESAGDSGEGKLGRGQLATLCQTGRRIAKIHQEDSRQDQVAVILGNFSVQATADIESKTYRQTRMYKLVNASKEEGLVRTPGTHLLPPASMTRFPVLLLPKSSRGARVWLSAPRLFAGLGHFAPLREMHFSRFGRAALSLIPH